MSKHKQRRKRRMEYYEMLRAELSDEEAFKSRVNRVLFSKDGEDFAPDGKLIKGTFFEAIEAWKKTDPQSARACLNLIENTVHRQSALSCINFVGRALRKK